MTSSQPGTVISRPGIDDRAIGAVTAPGKSATIATDLTYQAELSNMFRRPVQAGELMNNMQTYKRRSHEELQKLQQMQKTQ